MALEPVEYAEKVTVNGHEGVVVRSVAVRGGVEYLVRVADPDAAANETLKLPPGYDYDAAFVPAGGEEVYAEQNEADEKARKELDETLAKERADYVSKENERTESADDADETADKADADKKDSAKSTKESASGSTTKTSSSTGSGTSTYKDSGKAGFGKV